MTVGPREISADKLAFDALAICEAKRIGALLVVDGDRRLAGLVELKGRLSLGNT